MIDTYAVFDTVEAWQLEIGDPAILDNEHVLITDILETDDADEVLVVGLSQETGETERYPLVWDQSIQLWRIEDDDDDD